VNLTMLLCDWAEAVNGKLYCQGGGWTHLQVSSPSDIHNMAVGIVIAVPWDETNTRHKLELNLLDADGKQVMMGDTEVGAKGSLEVGRPAGVKPGLEQNAVQAYRFNGVALPPGGYVWMLAVGEEAVARTPFWVVG
jgi:hypothetical protein